MRSCFVRVFVTCTSLVLAVACGTRTSLFADDYAGIASPAENDASTTPKPPDAGQAPLACQDGTFSLTPATTQVLFVIDRSGSMASAIDGRESTPENPSRWSVLADALAPILRESQGSLELGAVFFPEPIDPDLTEFPPDEACRTEPTIDVPPSLRRADAILEVFSTTIPRGGTPTAEAIRIGANYLSAPERRSLLRYMVLATDGAPNCNAQNAIGAANCTCTSVDPTLCAAIPEQGIYSCLDDVSTIDAIRTANDSLKIPTFVIGIGETDRPEFAPVLDAMAVAGGRARAAPPRYYDVRSAEVLASSLRSIQANIAQCTYVTPSRPDDPNAIDVTVDGARVPRDTTHTEGWDWVDQDFGALAFFGGACTNISGAVATRPLRLTASVRCE